VVSTTGLEQGLVNTATAGNDADSRTAGHGEDLLGTRGELDAGLALVGVVGNDGGIVSRSTGERSTVTDLLLNVEDDGTLGHLADGKDVSDGELGYLFKKESDEKKRDQKVSKLHSNP
jgi:hypothetical protein